jgi:hypothetical protein
MSTEYFSNPDFELRPPYQRHLVWNRQQKSNLVDTIMRGLPMPIFLVYKCEQEQCVDGQNRMNTIKEYINQLVDPWAWVKDDTEYIYYHSPTTEAAMAAYCNQMNLKKRTKTHRLMTPAETKTFNNYQCIITEIRSPLTLEERQDLFTRWQSGTPISQCDKLKNKPFAFCTFVMENGLEQSIVPQINKIVRSDKNWLFDLYRLVNVFGVASVENAMLSTLDTGRLMKNDNMPADIVTSLPKCVDFLNKCKCLCNKKLYTSVLLSFAFEWNRAPEKAKIESDAFVQKLLIKLDKIEQNTLNNGIDKDTILEKYSDFKKIFDACLR